MTTRYADSLFKASNDLLTLFSLTKGGNRKGEFPYGQSDEEIIQTFRVACNSRENYLEFIDLYKRLIRSFEVHIKAMKVLEQHFSFQDWLGESGSIRADIGDIQSTKDRMSNEVAKLIHLRVIGKRWRREVNELLLQLNEAV